MPVRWVSSLLYGVVLVAGGYADLAGLGDTRLVPFAGGLAVLVLLDVVERRRFRTAAGDRAGEPARTPAAAAVALLAARLALFAVVAAADGSGLSRVLFLLVPFTAYVAFGRAAALALGAGCAGLLVAAFTLTEPGWYRSAEPVSDLLMFGVGLVLTIAMAAAVVDERRGRARLRAYAAQVAELSTAAERNRLARDIHDGLGHHLTAVSVLLEKAAAFHDRDPAVVRQAVDDAHRASRRALDDVRRSVRALRADAAPFRLSAALGDLVRAAGDGRPAITLECAGDETGYGAEALIALYRAAQEGITNARRHAGAHRIRVSVHCDASSARLVVADDGRGFPPERAGFGLRGMRERIALAGGTVDVDSGPARGTRLTVTIPHG
ncbi:sensor histidine kinase [Actinomycetes bacterium KLBMP 9797]